MTKLTEILIIKCSMQDILFHFSRSAGSIKILVSIENLGQYKILPWDKFAKKKITFRQTFHSMQFFLESQCLVDDLVAF